jgi:hypothetical protein
VARHERGAGENGPGGEAEREPERDAQRTERDHREGCGRREPRRPSADPDGDGGHQRRESEAGREPDPLRSEQSAGEVDV